MIFIYQFSLFLPIHFCVFALTLCLYVSLSQSSRFCRCIHIQTINNNKWIISSFFGFIFRLFRIEQWFHVSLFSKLLFSIINFNQFCDSHHKKRKEEKPAIRSQPINWNMSDSDERRLYLLECTENTDCFSTSFT